MSARNGAGSACIVPLIWSSIVETRISTAACVLDGARARRRVDSAAEPGEQRHDRPGDDDRLGDRRRADMKQRLERQRRFHAILS